jgi:hypothetical protein
MSSAAPVNKSAAVHIAREMPPISSFRAAMRRYMTVAQLPDAWGIDPGRDLARARALANGPLELSPIAQADGPLKVGHVVTDRRRRVWRFRACEMGTGRCVYSRFVEAETVEEARQVGARWMTREMHKIREACGGKAPAALVGSALAI